MKSAELDGISDYKHTHLHLFFTFTFCIIVNFNSRSRKIPERLESANHLTGEVENGAEGEERPRG